MHKTEARPWSPASGPEGSPVAPYLVAFAIGVVVMTFEVAASRLVAPYVGISVIVWSCVIGAVMGGMGLGNVLGGRLADRVDPGHAVAPLCGLSAALVLNSLWMNALMTRLPGLDSLPWNLRGLAVVFLDFLAPAVSLGMIGPVVAKSAVARTVSPGRALGNISLCSSAGSIAGTFLAGFVLVYALPLSKIVVLVAAALALAAAATATTSGAGLILPALLTAAALVLGVLLGVETRPGTWGFGVGSLRLNGVTLLGHAAAAWLGAAAFLWIARRNREDPAATARDAGPPSAGGAVPDLAFLSFMTGATFLSFEVLAGRLVTRHLGSSLYNWASVLGVALGGVSLGAYVGGLVAGLIRREGQVRWVLRAASILLVTVILAETPPQWLSDLFNKSGASGDAAKAFLSRATDLSKLTLPGGAEVPLQWPLRVLFLTACTFLLPSFALGMIGPILTKLAVDRVRGTGLEGMAIGRVSGWGMIGSVAGALLTGLFLLDLAGSKGMVLFLACALALAATSVGSITDAAWAGALVAGCVLTFLPHGQLAKLGAAWGIREEVGDLTTTADEIAWLDESAYSFIKVENEPMSEDPEPDPTGDRSEKKTGDGPIDDLKKTPELDEAKNKSGRTVQRRTLVLDNLIHGYYILEHPERLDYDYQHIYALVTHRVARALAGGAGGTAKPRLRALFLGAGAYTFPRFILHAYPGSTVDVVEIDPAVVRANVAAMGLTTDTQVRTIIGDARQFVEQWTSGSAYDLVYGDAFNDFSVPWHITTREFNEKIKRLLSSDGVYIINIIDAYMSESGAQKRADEEIEEKMVKDETEKEAIRKRYEQKARRSGGFLGSWVRTAMLTFGKDNVYIFGTDEPGEGRRETYVVAASVKPLDLKELGLREDDPKFFTPRGRQTKPKAYGEADFNTVVNDRSRGIVLTDDYAPVENLLLPVVETRGEP